MTNKDYNALAAEMMGYETFPPEMEHGLLVAITKDYRMWWNPLQDRNQAFQLLKRAEALGLADEVIWRIIEAVESQTSKDEFWQSVEIPEHNIYLLPYEPTISDIWGILTSSTDILTRACVDVWEVWKAQQNQGQKGHGGNE